jgi:hypothetical protein
MMCIRVRWHVSNLDGARLSDRASLHLEGCEACATFQDRLIRLEGNLKATRLTAPHPATARRRSARWPLALASGAAIAVAAFLYLQVGTNQTSSNDARDSLTVAAGDAAPTKPLQTSSVGEGLLGAHAKVISSVRKLGEIDDPLERELAAWRSDGLRGLESIRRLGRDENSPAL